MGKPFHYEELVARLRAVLRRRAQRRQGPRRIGELFVDPSTREVRVAGRRVELANKEFALLRALAAEPTRVFSNPCAGFRGSTSQAGGSGIVNHVSGYSSGSWPFSTAGPTSHSRCGGS